MELLKMLIAPAFDPVLLRNVEFKMATFDDPFA